MKKKFSDIFLEENDDGWRRPKYIDTEYCQSDFELIIAAFQIYINLRIWHYFHTNEEKKQEWFSCEACDHPEILNSEKLLFLINVLIHVKISKYDVIRFNIFYYNDIKKWMKHLLHKYYHWIPQRPACMICYNKEPREEKIKRLLQKLKYFHF